MHLEVKELSDRVTALVDPGVVTGTRATLLVEVGLGAPLGDAGLTVVGRGEGVPDQAVRLVLTTFGTPLPDGPPVVGM